MSPQPLVVQGETGAYPLHGEVRQSRFWQSGWAKLGWYKDLRWGFTQASSKHPKIRSRLLNLAS